MVHLHHIVPKHMGGTDETTNLVWLTIEEHAEAHKKLFEKHNNVFDMIAWKALSGQITMSEASQLAKKEGQKLGGIIQGKKSVENGHLSSIRTKEAQKMGAKARYEKHGHIHSNLSEESYQRFVEGKAKGGKLGGKKCFENKTGIFAPENVGKGGRIGGKIGGPKGMAIVNAMRYQCNDCGYTSRPRWVKYHLEKTQHTGYTKL